MTKMPEGMNNPTETAAKLLANPKLLEHAPHSAETTYEVSLSEEHGCFVLNWKASATGTYDWVGLFENDKVKDSKYLTGNNWQWATHGNSFQTDTATKVGYQARYLIWDAQRREYVSVAHSAPWKG